MQCNMQDTTLILSYGGRYRYQLPYDGGYLEPMLECMMNAGNSNLCPTPYTWKRSICRSEVSDVYSKVRFRRVFLFERLFTRYHIYIHAVTFDLAIIPELYKYLGTSPYTFETNQSCHIRINNIVHKKRFTPPKPL